MSTLSQRLTKLKQDLAARQKVIVVTFVQMGPQQSTSTPSASQPGSEGVHRLPNGQEVVLIGGSKAARAKRLERLCEEAKNELLEQATAESSERATEAIPTLGLGSQLA